jgi:transcriptional regulator with XRE-family HTH domain
MGVPLVPKMNKLRHVTTNYGERLNAAVASELRAERAAHQGMTIAKLVEASGIGKSQLLRLLNNQRDIDMQDVALLTQALGMEPAELMRRAQDRLAKEDAS